MMDAVNALSHMMAPQQQAPRPVQKPASIAVKRGPRRASASFHGVLRPYSGDIFGTQGTYMQGRIYRSRLDAKQKQQQQQQRQKAAGERQLAETDEVRCGMVVLVALSLCFPVAAHVAGAVHPGLHAGRRVRFARCTAIHGCCAWCETTGRIRYQYTTTMCGSPSQSFLEQWQRRRDGGAGCTSCVGGTVWCKRHGDDEARGCDSTQLEHRTQGMSSCQYHFLAVRLAPRGLSHLTNEQCTATQVLEAMAQEGATQAVAALAMIDDKEIRQDCAVTLCNMLSCEGTALLIAYVA